MIFPESFIEEVRLRLPISKVIGAKVALKKYGNYLKGLCPFHGEKTPSFTVHDSKGMYYCFGCHAYGDIYKFVSETEKLNFNETVKYLANLGGIALPSVSSKEQEREVKKDSLYKLLSKANDWFTKQLNLSGNIKAYRYLLERGLKEEDIKHFSVGFAPGGGLIKHLTKEGFTEDLIVDAGLAIKTQDKSYIEKFRNRIIFPIRNLKKQVVGFGGRALDNEVIPKYLNSPETSLFKKKNLLYAADLAKEFCLQKNRVIVVEGYMDAIFMHQIGVHETTASLGTAFNEGHIAILKSLADEIILCFDSDEAGKKAMIKAANTVLSSLEPGYNFKFCILGGGKDPDEIIKNHGRKYLIDLIENSLSIADYLFTYEKSYLRSNNPEATALFEHKMNEYAGKISNSIISGHFKNYFKNKIRSEFSAYNFKNTKFFEKKPKSLPSVSDLSAIKRLEYSIFAQIFNCTNLMRDNEIVEEISRIDGLPEELEKLKTVILFCHEKEEFEENTLKNLLLEKNLVKLVEFLCGNESSFIDQFSNFDDVLARKIWFLTQKKYVLELHLEDYHNILLKACDDSTAYEKAISLKKVIDNLKIEILNIENNI